MEEKCEDFDRFWVNSFFSALHDFCYKEYLKRVRWHRFFTLCYVIAAWNEMTSQNERDLGINSSLSENVIQKQTEKKKSATNLSSQKKKNAQKCITNPTIFKRWIFLRLLQMSQYKKSDFDQKIWLLCALLSRAKKSTKSFLVVKDYKMYLSFHGKIFFQFPQNSTKKPKSLCCQKWNFGNDFICTFTASISVSISGVKKI